ncbi:hypothetical protein C823_004043 [Eubacterium plexicaudatum ASF492]|uniref:ORC1/DEAH AAA+ ATPase domain-containing protein n=1 Tax=Eubacterium plexicaudatum ASF492 TaxID=1235802 RepID=N1ZX68_9FIRM|nr:hypothetical protein C823_004043 [Eubacterium plexicaudatum ASF492]
MDLSIAKERLAAVVKPDSITASQGDFLATHVEIKKLVLLNKFEFVPASQKYTSEEDIYKRFIMNPANRHQFIVVYGQSGSGKSHLIRWFEARYKADRSDDEVVLFIRRSDNTLKGTIRQLLEKSEVQDIGNKEIIKRLANASAAVSEDKLKDMIYHNFIIEINNDNDELEIQLNNIKRKRLVAFLNNETIHDHMMESGGPIERIYSKVAENSFADLDTIAQFKPEDFIVSVDLYDDMWQAGADPKADKMAKALMANDAMEDAKKFSDYLNQFVEIVIQRCAGIEPGDFEQVFMDIRKELYRLGKNLTLFIEDVTSFTGVDNALLNALMEEHNDRDICRLSSVVGGTNAYINDCFRQNHRDRVTQYVYIPDDVFDENGIFEFVGRYVNAMSLPMDVISAWVDARSLPGEYPVHEVVEGKKWEYIDIPYDKKLCLYPFSKNSIRYLYKNELTRGHQTPRYMIRDIIEPVVSDLLYNAENFPSKKYALVNINTTLNFIVHNQVKDEEQADRVFRFMSIWGNNEAKQFTIEDVTYIAGLPAYVYEELDLPIVNLQNRGMGEATSFVGGAGSKQGQTGETGNDGNTGRSNEGGAGATVSIPPEKQKKLDEANAKLTQWANGMPINLSTTGGAEGTIRTAREDMGDFLMSAINWQAEGVSLDNVSKVKAAISGKASKYKLVALENQTKGNGYYTLPATWDSLNVINAFIRWREFGNQSWEYPKSDFDVYQITSWTARIKKQIVKAVSLYDDKTETKYIEAAMAAEIYQLILNGEYREKTIGNLTAEYLFCNHQAKNKNTWHSNEWKSLLSLVQQKGADAINRETVRQYFNILQGSAAGSVVVLDAVNLAKTIRKVKTSKLQIPEEELQMDDKVKLRKDTYSFLTDITSRIDSVARAEVETAKKAIQPIYDCFDDDDVEEEDISAFLTKVNQFYKEIDNTQINIKTASTDSVKKGRKQFAKAISDITRGLDEDDPLTVLMAFSGDPIGTIQPLLALINQVSGDITKAEKQIIIRKNNLGVSGSGDNDENHYREELSVIESDFELLGALR